MSQKTDEYSLLRLKIQVRTNLKWWFFLLLPKLSATSNFYLRIKLLLKAALEAHE